MKIIRGFLENIADAIRYLLMGHLYRCIEYHDNNIRDILEKLNEVNQELVKELEGSINNRDEIIKFQKEIIELLEK